jgi:ribosomal protein S6E (S10)
MKFILNEISSGRVIDLKTNVLNRKLGDVFEEDGQKYKITGGSTSDGFPLVRGMDHAGKSTMMVQIDKKTRIRKTKYGRIINNNVTAINLVKVV